MKQTETTETEVEFSTIGQPAKFDREQMITYRDALARLILNIGQSYKRDLMRGEWLAVCGRINYYDENKVAYNL